MNKHLDALPVMPPCRSANDLAAALRDAVDRGAFQPGSRLPTLHALAGLTGLSYKTVQRAVEMLAREGKVVTRRGAGTFVPKPSGAAAAGAGTLRIGVAPPFWGDSPKHFVFSAIMHGMCEEAAAMGHRIEVVHLSQTGLTSWDAADDLLRRGLDAFICIQPPQVFAVTLVRLMERGIPVILTGRGFSEIPAPVVRDDLDAGAERVADWMVERGRRDLVMLTGLREDQHTRPRVDALRRALGARGLSLPDENIRTIYFGGMAPPYGYEDAKASCRAQRFLEEHGRFDAVFTMSATALGAAARISAAGNRTCPRDFSVIHLEQAHTPGRQACPDIPVSLLVPPLTAIGREAIRVAEARCGREPSRGAPSLLPTLDPAP